LSRRKPKPIFGSRRRRRTAPDVMLAICACLFVLVLLAIAAMVVIGGT